jgi:hypothetical protein
MILNRLAEQWRTLARLTSCRDMESLELQGNWGTLEEMPDLPANLKTFIAGPGIVVKMRDAVQVLTKRAATLKHAEFHSLTSVVPVDWTPPTVDLPQLETLVLARTVVRHPSLIDAESRAIKVMVDRATNLKRLILRWDSTFHQGLFDLQDFSQLETLELNGLLRESASYDNLPSSLRCLHLPANETPLDPSAHDGPSLPDLKSLAITGCKDLNNLLSDLRILLENRQRMVEGGRHTPRRIRSFSLSVSRMMDHTSDSLWNILNLGCFDLEELSLAEPTVDDGLMDRVLKRHPNLRRINIPQTRITGVTVKAAVTRLKQLEFLGIEDCASVSNDAVQWAKGQGIHLTAPNVYRGENGGRRVRYG